MATFDEIVKKEKKFYYVHIFDDAFNCVIVFNFP